MNELTLERFTAWMTEYGRASAENDPQASANLFATDARYYENPFDAPMIGRGAIYEYWNKGTQNLKDKKSSFEILSVSASGGTCGKHKITEELLPQYEWLYNHSA